MFVASRTSLLDVGYQVLMKVSPMSVSDQEGKRISGTQPFFS